MDKLGKLCRPKEAGRLGKRTDASFFKKSICKGLSILRKGIRMRVEDSTDINVWHEPWLPRPYSFKLLQYARFSASNIRWSTSFYMSQTDGM